jgi:glycosyltransferase involved in cell wall biosynthesis
MSADVVTPAAPSRDEQIAAAQLQRDRDRLAAAQAEIVALRYRVDQLERSPSRRLFGPARRTVRFAARALRVAKRLAKIAPAAPQTLPPAGPASRGLVLVIDYHWPEPDRDSGSVDIFNLMQALKALGFEPILAAAEQHDGPQPARDRLIAQGIRCLLPRDAPSVAHYVVRHGAALDLCVLCRVYCGAAFLEMVQIHCRKARLIFNSIDLNFVREERRAHLTGDAKLLAMIDQLRAREEHVIRSCDATLVVSEAEYALLAETMPASLVAQMPLARPIHPPVTPFAARRGIGFVGSFAHGPNVDAMRWFLSEIWPLVRRGLPDCTLSIVGAGAPADLTDGADESVQVLGHVPDLGPWFESLRLTVAPLRFGAGAKGKVASSLSAGLPCIATPMAAEGMALADDGGVLVESDPAAFAAALIRAYGDEVLWTRLSAGGLDHARRNLSLAHWQDLLDTTLRRIGL